MYFSITLYGSQKKIDRPIEVTVNGTFTVLMELINKKIGSTRRKYAI